MPISFCVWPQVKKRAGVTLLKVRGPDNYDGINRFEIVVYDTGFDAVCCMRPGRCLVDAV